MVPDCGVRLHSTFICALSALVAIILADASMAAERSQISVPAESIVTVDSLSGVSVESSVRTLSRQIEWGGTVLDLDGLYWTAGVAWSPLPYILLGGFAGGATADMESREGDYGLIWGVESSIAVLEYVLAESPVFGRTKAVRFMADIEFLRAEPDLDGNDITIEEVTLAPHVVYAVNLRGAKRWHPHGLLGVAIRGGVVVSSMAADIDGHSFEETNSFGLLFGADMQFNNEIRLRLTSHLFGEDDMMIAAGLGYHF